jgi:aldehyde:ferredoxin oxidoreductase
MRKTADLWCVSIAVSASPFVRTDASKWSSPTWGATMINEDAFRVLVADLSEKKARPVSFGNPLESVGGSGLAATLFSHYGLMGEPPDHPDQPLIFAIGPLTGFFPLMSKAVMGFKSPYTGWYTESHAGGRLASALRFAGYDALVVKGVAKRPSCLIVGRSAIEFEDAHYLWGLDSLTAGKHLRRLRGRESGQRSILRIGPAGERGVAFASVNVDTYRHFGRLGGGAAMGAKKLKAIMVLGDGSLPLPDGKDYPDLYRTIFKEATQTPVMKKYHDLGTAENMLVLNELHMLPWMNLQETHNEAVSGISGERFAEEALLRKTACAGCPVGCIHVGLLREKFADQNEFLYRQVSYDHEPVFAAGAMLGMTRTSEVLILLEEMERLGLDVISGGVALAWAVEAFQKGIVSEKETVVPLAFGDLTVMREAAKMLGLRTNDFYRVLGQGAGAAAANYGGADFTCSLGQEMAGYATGEVFFVSQAYGFRHSHLDSAGYGLDQKPHEKNVDAAVSYLLDEERRRVQLTCMVSCLFARNIYSEQRLQECLRSLGGAALADLLPERTGAVQAERWRLKHKTGYDPGLVSIPKRFREVVTRKGPMDAAFMDGLAEAYQVAVRNMAKDLESEDVAAKGGPTGVNG